MSSAYLWSFLLAGYTTTVAIELPILLGGLSPRHAYWDRVYAGLWLTACTYPIVVLVLPLLLVSSFGRPLYLLIAETFAPLAECLLFYFVVSKVEFRRQTLLRDCTAIVVANLASFLTGELWNAY